MKTTHSAFILGLYIPGIAIIKHLSKLNIEIIGLSYIRNVPGFKLRFSKTYYIPSPNVRPELLVNWLINKAQQYSHKPVLFNTSDDFVQFLDTNKDKLKDYFLFPWESTGIAKMLTSKLELSRYAKSIKVALPNTFEVEDESDLNLNEISYPCLIKPLYANEWRSNEMKAIIGSNKVIIIQNSGEMDNWRQKLKGHKAKYLIQELIPGPDDNLFYCVVYRSRKGEIIRYFCGQKIRITPVHFGSASYVKTVSPDVFIPEINKLLGKSNYIGPAGIEFKIDDRDGSYKLIEVNARYGLWDNISIDLGTDVFGAYYEDFTEQNPKLLIPDSKIVRWLSLSRDIPDFINYIKEKQLSWFDWFKSLAPPLKIAEYFEGEIPLFLYMILSKPLNKLKRILHV